MNILPIDEIGNTSVLAYYPLDISPTAYGVILGEEWDETLYRIVKTVALVDLDEWVDGAPTFRLTTLATFGDIDLARARFLAECIDRSVAPEWS